MTADLFLTGVNGVSKIKYYGGWNIDDDKAHKFGITYLHTMSKRTNIYATYGKMSQDEEMDGTLISQAFGASADSEYVGYESTFKVGLRHQF